MYRAEPYRVVKVGTVEVVDDVEARRTLHMVDRGHIQEQLETEFTFQALNDGQQILRAQPQLGHAEALGGLFVLSL